MNYCSYACRTIVFLTIVFMVAYIMMKNEKSIEKFVVDRVQPKVTTAQKETITTVFRNYLGRDPTAEDVSMMAKTMVNDNDIISVVDAVKGLDEYKTIIYGGKNDFKGDTVLKLANVANSPLIRDLQKVDLDTRMETYRKVIDSYQRVVERMPSNKELVFYAHRMLSDPAFSQDKLERILEGSNEYKILTKNQINIVNGQLPGNITDAQLTMDVINKYRSVYNKEPDADTVEFLKAKYLAYKLDEVKFDHMLVLMNQVDNNNFTVSETGEITLKFNRGDKVAAKIAAQKEYSRKNFGGLDNASVGIGKFSPLLEKVEDKPVGQEAPIKEAATKCKMYKDPFYQQLAQAQGRCNFNDDIAFDRDLYSEYRSKRNEDELNTMCSRGAGNDMYKEYETKRTKNTVSFDAKPSEYTSEPFDAATLNDARNTMVGSILPPFIYNEVTP